jgi:hypothetical protein
VNQPAFVMAILGFSVTTASMLGPAFGGMLIEGPAGQKDHREASVSSKGIVGNMCSCLLRGSRVWSFGVLLFQRECTELTDEDGPDWRHEAEQMINCHSTT